MSGALKKFLQGTHHRGFCRPERIRSPLLVSGDKSGRVSLTCFRTLEILLSLVSCLSHPPSVLSLMLMLHEIVFQHCFSSPSTRILHSTAFTNIHWIVLKLFKNNTPAKLSVLLQVNLLCFPWLSYCKIWH